jgi:hypothetical protein
MRKKRSWGGKTSSSCLPFVLGGSNRQSLDTVPEQAAMEVDQQPAFEMKLILVLDQFVATDYQFH